MKKNNLIDGRPLKFAVMGISGSQGSQISKLALDLGYELIGGVGRGSRVGKPVKDFVDHPSLADGSVKVYESCDALIAAAGKPDVVLMAALLPLSETVEISCDLLRKGINVLSLEAGLVDPDLEEMHILDKAGKEGGASFLSSGLQDIWWVQLPAISAAASHRLTKVTLDDFSNLGMASRADGREVAALGMDDSEYDVWIKRVMSNPSNAIMAPSIKQLCRKLGFTAKDITFTVDRYTSDEPRYWWEIDEYIQPGNTTGVWYRSEMTTEEGVLFCGSLQWEVRDRKEVTYNSWIVEGDYNFCLKSENFDAIYTTSTAALRRLKDIVECSPGVHGMDEMPAPEYVHPVC